MGSLLEEPPSRKHTVLLHRLETALIEILSILVGTNLVSLRTEILVTPRM